LTLAETALAQGDLGAARQRLLAAFGPEAVTAAGGPPPRIQQVLVSVVTTPTGRHWEVRVAGEAGEAEQLLADARLALSGVADAVVRGDRLSVTLPSAEPARVLAVQTQLADALAGIPELALLAAALRPAELSWQTVEAPLTVSERYVESIDLTPARDAWMAQAERLLADAAVADGAEGLSLAARLARVQGRLWAGDAQAWRSLAERSRVTYRVTLRKADMTRAWELAPGDARPLVAAARTWRFDRLAWVAGGLAALLGVMVAAVWRATTAEAVITKNG